MDLRNIKRSFCFGRALAKRNKKSFIKLITSNVFILYSLCSLRKPSTVAEIQEHLKRNKHHYSTTVINENLKLFLAQEWVKIDGTYPARYSITLEGRNELFTLERRIRSERADK